MTYRATSDRRIAIDRRGHRSAMRRTSATTSRAFARRLGRTLEALEDRRLLTASDPSMSRLDEISPGVFIERSAMLADIAGMPTSVSPAIAGVGGSGAGLALNGQGLQFNFIAAPGTPQTVIDGFDEAGQLWSHLIQDDIVVNVDISFPSLGPGILGSTSPTLGVVNYTSFLAAESADAHSPDDATALAHLQPGPGVRLLTNGTLDNPNGAGSLTPYVDDNGSINNTSTYLTYANAKALGLLSPSDSATDADISFSSNFNFDFDRSDGISPGEFDFVGVATHEIGHALGFGSGIDVLDTNIDQNGGPYLADLFGYGTLDLFRYSAASVADNAIDLTAGGAAGSQYFSIDGGATSLTKFATGEIFGDGDQASHWQDGLGIGIMDPTLAPSEFAKITRFDLQALDVIGWDVVPLVVVPDPIIDGTAGDDTFRVTRNPSDTSTVQVELNGVIVETFPLADLNSLTLNGLAGNDTLIVDSSQGLITLPAGIRFDGGSGFDALQLTQTDGPDIESDELVPGATPGSGLSIVKSPEIIIGAAVGGVAPAQDGEDLPAQIVAFQNLEPFTDDLPAPAFDISADVPPLIGFGPLASLLSADNAINYTQSETNGALGVDGTWGKVTIDAFEPIYFTNKDHLTVNAGAGSDTINLNNATTPTALAAITINGDDPTASDTLIVNGTTASEAIGYNPTGVGAGNVTVAGLPDVSFTTTEHLIINGQGGNDTLTVSTPNIDGTQVFTPARRLTPARSNSLTTSTTSLPRRCRSWGWATGGAGFTRPERRAARPVRLPWH